MKFKSFLFRSSTATAAFILGISFFGVWNWMPTLWQSDDKVAESQEPAPQIPEQYSQPTITVTQPAQNSPEFDLYKPVTFEDEGYFYIAGKQPKEFADFKTFSLQYWEYDEKKGETIKIPPTGYIEAKKEFDFKTLTLNQQNIVFETKQVGGISYQFSGKLVEKVYDLKEDLVYLEGHLKKLKNGKVIAEGDFKFGWGEYGC